MRRSNFISNDAFGLFLDTICNAFGGILFISLLVCIMLQLSGKCLADPKIDEVRQARLKGELSGLDDEITRLMDQLAGQLGQLEMIESAADSQLLKKYKLLKNEELRQAGIYQKRTAGNDTVLIDLAEINKRLGCSRKQLDELAEKYSALEKKFKPVKARRAQVVDRGGVARMSGKTQIPVLVSGGRLIFVYKYDSRGKPISKNEDECEFVRKLVGGKTKIEIRPKDGCGIAVDSHETVAKILADRLAKFTAAPTEQNNKKENQCHNFMLAVWPDSYKQARIFRDILISNGFDYGLILLKKDQPIGTGGANVVQ